MIESALGEAFERGVVVDAVVAFGSAQAAALWALREGIRLRRGEGAFDKGAVLGGP